MSKNNDPSLPLPKVIDSKIVFEESIVKIKKDLLQVNRSSPYPYYSLITPPASVIIVAITLDAKYVCNEEYRHPVGHTVLCFPGGYIDDQENVLDAAKRELFEETGYVAASYDIIGCAYPYVGISGQKVFYVKAEGAAYRAPPQPETSEIFQVKLLHPEEINHEISKGTRMDGTLCTALFFLLKNSLIISKEK
jgi:ADP-ribose pyrophosphatase